MNRISPYLSANIIAKALGCWGDSASPPAGVFAVFLTAAGLTGRLEELLAQNRQSILLERKSGWKANAISASNLLALFLGSFVAIAIAAL